MTFTYRYRKQIIVFSFLIIIVCGGGAFLFMTLKAEPVEAKQILKVEKKEEKEEKGVDIKTYKVDIKGEIINPGIYTLNKDSRVIDVITEAGGLTEFADTSVINLSKKITDEMVIIIYNYEEVKEFAKTKEREATLQQNCMEGGDYELKNDACIENKEDTISLPTNSKVSLNTATKEELMTLPGIGESKAIAIIEYREQNGLFEKIEDIKNVSGIGENVFAKIQENITT